MNVKRTTTILSVSVTALSLFFAVALVLGLARPAFGDDLLSAHRGERGHETQNAQQQPAGDLVRAVRESTRRFRNVDQAKAEGYLLMFGCVSGPDDGAMGLHYVNLALVGDGILDPARPEIVIYEPLPNGGRRLIGADFLVFAETWHASNTATPQVMGQLMHLIDSPNRYGLPAFYTLHVWAWKPSPTGAFVNWHADVSCEHFDNKE
jgi:hypothetical protein